MFEISNFSNVQMVISPQPLEIINQNQLHLDRIDLSFILEPFLAGFGASDMLLCRDKGPPFEPAFLLVMGHS